MSSPCRRPTVKKIAEVMKKIVAEIGAKGVSVRRTSPRSRSSAWGCVRIGKWRRKMFSAMAKEGINIMMISTSEIRSPIVIDAKYTELAVRVLHETFEMTRRRRESRVQETRNRTERVYLRHDAPRRRAGRGPELLGGDKSASPGSSTMFGVHFIEGGCRASLRGTWSSLYICAASSSGGRLTAFGSTGAPVCSGGSKSLNRLYLGGAAGDHLRQDLGLHVLKALKTTLDENLAMIEESGAYLKSPSTR